MGGSGGTVAKDIDGQDPEARTEKEIQECYHWKVRFRGTYSSSLDCNDAFRVLRLCR